ncbi:hypothetical protein CYMTET_19766 [Cymbomonas tetramitiformis]|uniref:Reverse transcriptase domain-containing protein n=1 Tax=Cymbomonas tetramitiformis TaxID=36881 RepID=A0AAE0L4V2_9CHLO|nr:hypothetical protein CYMTET_19766 [Cymbomonas tetramitiformis]
MGRVRRATAALSRSAGRTGEAEERLSGSTEGSEKNKHRNCPERNLSDAETLSSANISSDRKRVSRTHTQATLQEEKVFLQQVQKILDILKDDIVQRNLYISLFAQLCIFIFYMFVMYLQFQELNAYETVSSISSSLKPDNGLEFLPWLKTQVLYIWQEPFCGDGYCEGPAEFPAFGRFGCREDCGVEPAISSVLVYIETARSRGARVLLYMDDFLLLGSNEEEAYELRHCVGRVLNRLGLWLNKKKGKWEPAQIVEHLGLEVELWEGEFRVTDARLKKICSKATDLLCEASRERHWVLARKLAGFVGP